MKLSEHFTLEELTRSNHAERNHIDNTPNEGQIKALQLLCAAVLEPLREMVHMPINVLSGFRNNSINRLVGGANNSQHMLGEAVDIAVHGMSIDSLFQLVKNNISYDQVIHEGTWVHVSFKEQGRRQQALKVVRNQGKTSYEVA